MHQPIGARRGAVGALEQLAEIQGVLHTDREGDLGDRKRAAAKLFGGKRKAVMIEIGKRGKPELLFEGGKKIGR